MQLSAGYQNNLQTVHGKIVSAHTMGTEAESSVMIVMAYNTIILYNNL